MTDIAGAVLVTAVESYALSPAETAFLKRAELGGVTLFGRNVPEHHEHVRKLTDSLQQHRASGAPPLVIAIDQEGGRVRRFKAPFPDPGPAMKMAGGRDDLESLSCIRSLARDMGGRLLSYGFNVDFAPCVDVLSEPTNSGIGDRAFATTAEPVAKRAGAFLAGLRDANVMGCLKHFPGQGDAKVDTHVGKAVVNVPLAKLKARELLPFAALIDQAQMIMVAHCIYPDLAPEEASCSMRIMDGLLRRDMRFRGVIVSDDMLMGAVPQDTQAWQESIVASVAAGADMLLVCRHLDRAMLAYDALKREAKRHPAFAARLTEAAGRVLAMRQSLAPAI